MPKKVVVYNWDKLPVVLTVKDVSLIFSICEKTVLNLIKTGELKAKKMGKSWRFDREYIRDYVENMCL